MDIRVIGTEFLNWLLDVVKKLGALGTISYVGAFYLFYVAISVDFSTEATKAWLLAFIGTVLLLASGVIYCLEMKEEASKVREALGVLKEVFNRLSEQTAKGSNGQTGSIVKAINNLPTKISEVIKKAKVS